MLKVSCAVISYFSHVLKPAMLGQSNDVSRGFDRHELGCLQSFCGCGRANSHSAWTAEGGMPWPTKTQGPFPDATCSKTAPGRSAKCCAVFSSNRRQLLCRANCSVGLSCTPICSASSPRVTGHAAQMKLRQQGYSHTSLVFVSWAFLLRIQSSNVGRSLLGCCCDSWLHSRHLLVALFWSTPATARPTGRGRPPCSFARISMVAWTKVGSSACSISPSRPHPLVPAFCSPLPALALRSALH